MNANQIQFLEKVNQDLIHAIAIAAKDYNLANDRLKTYYNKINTAGDSMVNLMVETNIEAIMIGLQYMDIFSQRMDHIVSTHQKMVVNNLDQNFTESFFHLHVFQALTIELDLLQSITSIQSLFQQLNAEFQENHHHLFEHTEEIKKNLRSTIDALLKEGGDAKNLPAPPLTENQILTLSSLYTMERERIVLNWFIHSRPHGTWQELLDCYEREINQTLVDNIELF